MAEGLTPVIMTYIKIKPKTIKYLILLGNFLSRINAIEARSPMWKPDIAKRWEIQFRK